MLTASSIGTALAMTTVLGAGITAYLWVLRRPQLLVSNGIASLAAMRWREFAHFVVDALRAQGFDHDPTAPRPQKGQQADMLLSRDGETWLLGCKQSPDEVTTAPQVVNLARSVRETAAGGGILATLGNIAPDARVGREGVELLDGPAVWTLVEPLLPQSLQLDIAQRARSRTVHEIQLSWLGALLLGFALAMLLPTDPDSDTAPVAAGTAPIVEDATVAPPAPQGTDKAAAVAARPPVAAAKPENEEQQRRDDAMREISRLPGVQEAIWASRSTLVVYLADAEASKQDVAALCATLERYEELRASRLQLQPPAASEAPVRFMQCHVY